MSESGPETAPGSTRPRSPRWMWIVLSLSLALNLAVVGAAGAAMWGFHKHGGRRGGSDDPRSTAYFLKSLPAARREELRALFDAERDKMRASRQVVREKRDELKREFTADPLDTERLAAAVKAATDAHVVSVTQRGEFFERIAGRLDAEERRAYIRWKDDRRRFWRHRRWRGHQRRDDAQ